MTKGAVDLSIAIFEPHDASPGKELLAGLSCGFEIVGMDKVGEGPTSHLLLGIAQRAAKEGIDTNKITALVGDTEHL